MNIAAPCEKWIWTEMLAFDTEQPDLGVQAYLDTVGYIPDVISLLLSAPDFVLLHTPLDQDRELPADCSSRDGHSGNETRRRQTWTSFQVREVVARLHEAGVQVYLSFFTHYLKDKFHREFLSDHPEAKVVFANAGRANGLNILARLNDGTYLHTFFAAQLAQVCKDYGFDGLHGPDGFGPLGSPIYNADCSDDMIGQFMASGQHDLPECVTASSEDLPEKLQARINWIWQNRRMEWIEFWTNRWALFWGTVADSLHSVGCKAFINSSWTRDPFEGIYRYGIDYRKIIDAGVDGIVVETVAGSLMLGLGNRDYHYDFLAMLMLYKAYVPETKLVCLLPIKDVAEDWDLLRHAPTMLEREIYALGNVFHTDSEGNHIRCNSGFVACLGDGIESNEWEWLNSQWHTAFDTPPYRIVGASLVCAHNAVHNQLADYPKSRHWSSHRIAYHLMERKAPIQTSIDVASASAAQGPLLVPNPHYFSADQRRQLLESGNPVIAIGPDFTDWPDAALEFIDGGPDQPMRCRLYNAVSSATFDTSSAKITPGEPIAEKDIVEPIGFRQDLHFRSVSEEFLKACASLVEEVTGAIRLAYQEMKFISDTESTITAMVTEQSPGAYRLALKNSSFVYGQVQAATGLDIESIKPRSTFPVKTIKVQDGTFSVRVPPRGIVILDVATK
jgi:hypothetical protein